MKQYYFYNERGGLRWTLKDFHDGKVIVKINPDGSDSHILNKIKKYDDRATYNGTEPYYWYPVDGGTTITEMKFAFTPRLTYLPVINVHDLVLGKALQFEDELPDEFNGQLKGFPKNVVKRMMECQVEQGNKADYTVFENSLDSDKAEGGFTWALTTEGARQWHNIINKKKFATIPTKKLIGYKLKPTTKYEWLKPFIQGTNEWITEATFSFIDSKIGYWFTPDSILKEAFEKAGVLNVWFCEVYEEDKQKKTFFLDSDAGTFELEISKEGIYYATEDIWFNIKDLKKIVKDAFPDYCIEAETNNSSIKQTYKVEYASVTLGCRKSIPIIQLKAMMEYYNSIN